ncbi:MAG: acyltransferase, partial [Alphaproteobacteria bacterium]|nr:acyltransferase [Alphaproteobacteria bacterium]
RISYSLYLFHWPLIVFYGLYRETVFGPWEQAGLLAVGIGLAALSYRFVETPFRGAHRRSGRPWAETKIAGAALVTGAAALAVSLTAGLPQRLSPAAQAVAAELEAITVNPKGCHRVERLAPFKGGQLCTYAGPDAGPDSRFGYLLWGDSHARVMAKGLQQLTPVPGLVLDVSACPALQGVRRSDQGNATACDASQARALALVRDERIPVVVLASRWATVASPVPSPGDGLAPWHLYDRANGHELRFADALARTVAQFRDLGARVILVGPVPEAPFDVPKTLMRAVHLQQPMPAIDRASFDRRQTEVLPVIAAEAKRPGVAVFWPHDRMCDADTCRVVDGHTPLYADDDHLSLPGSLEVLPGLADLVLRTVTAARQTAPITR